MTDGKVKGSTSCVDMITKFCNGQVNMLGLSDTIDNKVYSFGIGDGADVEFIKQSAALGRGEFYFTKNQHDDLANKVIDALQKSVDPCFEESSINFLYRNESN